MSNELERRIARLEEAIPQVQEILAQTIEEADEEDGRDEVELALIARIEEKIGRLEAQLENLRSQLAEERGEVQVIELDPVIIEAGGDDEVESDDGVIQLDPVFVEAGGEERVFEGEEIIIESRIAGFFDEGRFQREFSDSIKDWAQDCQIELNRAHSNMTSMSSPTGLSLGDFINVVIVAVTSSTGARVAFATVGRIASILQHTIGTFAPSTPDINAIHTSMHNGFGDYGNADHSNEYAAFVADYRSRYNIQNDEIPVELFINECRQFAQNHLPTPNRVARAFLTECLAHVEDDILDPTDWGDGGATGYAVITMRGEGETFYFHEGYLDDVPEELLASIRSTWSRSRVIDLPVRLKFRIEARPDGADWSADDHGQPENPYYLLQATIERSSRTEGNTSFSLTGGSHMKDDILALFNRLRFYENVMVSDLEVE